MTKSELIDKIANRHTHLTQKDAEIIVDTILDSMTEALKTVAGERMTNDRWRFVGDAGAIANS